MNPNRCDQRIYDKGACIAVLGDVEKDDVERWCRETSRRLGALVDWHYMGGRPRVLTLGNATRADAIFQQVMEGEPPEGVVKVVEERLVWDVSLWRRFRHLTRRRRGPIGAVDIEEERLA